MLIRSPTARSQTVLPNPCCRIQHSSFHSHDDNVPSVRLEGEPTFKRRPGKSPLVSSPNYQFSGPINLISTTPKFTPISVADTRTILHTINTGDRIHTDQVAGQSQYAFLFNSRSTPSASSRCLRSHCPSSLNNLSRSS